MHLGKSPASSPRKEPCGDPQTRCSAVHSPRFRSSPASANSASFTLLKQVRGSLNVSLHLDSRKVGFVSNLMVGHQISAKTYPTTRLKTVPAM